MQALRREVLAALAESESDFRTTASLARQLGVAEAKLRTLLLEDPAVRRPALARTGEEQDWHRLVNRGLTRREKYRVFLAIASRDVR